MAPTQARPRGAAPKPGPKAHGPADHASASDQASSSDQARAAGQASAADHASHVGTAGAGSPGQRPGIAAARRPLLIDVGIPVGSCYLLRDAFGLSLWLSLALSSIGPAVRSITGLIAERKLNLLAVLILAVNLAGIAVSFLTGDPRAMIAKESIVSSVIAFAILGSVLLRRPLMTAGLKPFMTKGEPRRTAAWDRLSAAS
jgi:hypothetical protein